MTNLVVWCIRASKTCLRKHECPVYTKSHRRKDSYPIATTSWYLWWRKDAICHGKHSRNKYLSKNGKGEKSKRVYSREKSCSRGVCMNRGSFSLSFFLQFFFLGQTVSPPAVTLKTVLHAVRFLQGNAKSGVLYFSFRSRRAHTQKWNRLSSCHWFVYGMMTSALIVCLECVLCLDILLHVTVCY